jgi:hypothetical protein
MGYESSKIYRLQHDDGHFYIGSSVNELRVRLGQHKKSCKMYAERRVYKHINNEWDKVKIVLIEAFECSNRDELRRKEQEYIQKELKNELCLNHKRAFLTEADLEEKKTNDNKLYYQRHSNEIKEYQKEYRKNNTEKVKTQQTEYRAEHKDDAKAYRDKRKTEIKEYNAKYRAEHLEEIKAREQAYRQRKKAEQSNLTDNLTEAV